MINILQYCCIQMIAFVCAMRYWEINLGFRLYIWDLLIIGFLLLQSINIFIIIGYISSINKCLKQYIVFNWIWIIIILLSTLNFIYDPISMGSFWQFFKGFSNTLFQTIFISFFIYFLANIDKSKREKIINIYILGVTLSVVYEILQVYLMKTMNVDLDLHVWDKISINVVRGEDDYLKRFAWGSFFRPSGFCGEPNGQGFYIVTALPYLILRNISKTSIKNTLIIMLLMLGLLLTQSRSAIVAFTVALFALVFLIKPKDYIKIAGQGLFYVLPIIAIIFIYYEFVAHFYAVRANIDDSRIDIFLPLWDLVVSKPLGVGYMGVSVYLEKIVGAQKYNSHNVWLTYLVEEGFPGLFFQIFMLELFLYITIRKKNIYARSYFVTIIGISIGSLFNQITDIFFYIFFHALFFTNAVLQPETD